MSAQSTYSDKGMDGKYICKLPFNEYNKQHKKFSRHLEKLCHIILAEAGSIGQMKIEYETELQNIMNRLFLQKRSYITKLAELEGVKAAREKVKELSCEIENLSWNATKSKLRREISNFEEFSSDLEDSFMRNVEDLSDTCEKWAEFQTLKPVCDMLDDAMESSNRLITKMDKIIDDMNTKIVADKILCDMMEWEDERSEACVNLYKTLREEIQGKLNSVNKRMDFMATSIQDYNDYCALQIEDRSELVEWLAAILGSDNKSVTQAVDIMTENSQKQHEFLFQRANQQMQTIISVEHKMKDFYYIDLQNKRKSKEKSNSELYKSIQMVLNEMYTEIMDLIIQYRSIKDDSESEEQNAIQEMLKKILQSS